VHYEIQGEVFDEEVGVVSEGLAIKSVEDGMPGTIGGGSATIGLTTLAVLQRLATKGSLVNLPFFRPRERDTEPFQLINDIRKTSH
jgi:hypothetical protein